MSEPIHRNFNLERLPKELQDQFRVLYYDDMSTQKSHLRLNEIYHGDARDLLLQIEPNSLALVCGLLLISLARIMAYLSFEISKHCTNSYQLTFRIIKPGDF
jgi:site-specific DNA-methyltransferase (adenine-specific)